MNTMQATSPIVISLTAIWSTLLQEILSNILVDILTTILIPYVSYIGHLYYNADNIICQLALCKKEC